MMNHLRGNQTRWEALLQQELAEETKTEISEAEEIPDDDLEPGNGYVDEEPLGSRRNSLHENICLGDKVG